MLKLLRCVREYKKATVLNFIFILIEAVMETIIPFVTASMLNGVQQGTDMSFILSRGGLLIVLAICSLCAGAIAGKTSAEASAGFAKNLRSDMFASIQRFSFANIDRFSSSSLVTRLTTEYAAGVHDDHPHGGACASYAYLLDNHGVHNGRRARDFLCYHHSRARFRTAHDSEKGYARLPFGISQV